MQFYTDYKYNDRKTKAQYVWLKYQSILGGDILDVGADKCYLKRYLPHNATYLGIGKGGQPDQQVDLENENLPFKDNSFDCVLCLDVLEHLENIHYVFDELCRVTRKYVILSLPNPWASFYNRIQRGNYSPGLAMKYYNLPLEPPDDRHKWFYSLKEAKAFIKYRAEKNGLTIVQIDYGNKVNTRINFKKMVKEVLFRFIIHSDFNINNFKIGSFWVVLKK